MAEKWAQDCAAYEERGTSDYVKATLEYERRFANGWSPYAIAQEVGAAGFRIGATTVKRRLAALSAARQTNARANSKAFLEAFDSAYAEANRQDRGGVGPREQDFDKEYQKAAGDIAALEARREAGEWEPSSVTEMVRHFLAELMTAHEAAEGVRKLEELLKAEGATR